MERNQILIEYWSLCKLLNQSNKLANEKTQVRFKIEDYGKSEYRLQLVTKGKQEEHKIEIARKERIGGWERSGFTEFKKFELFCANFLTAIENQQPQKYDHASAQLQKIFDDLMIFYEP